MGKQVYRRTARKTLRHAELPDNIWLQIKNYHKTKHFC